MRARSVLRAVVPVIAGALVVAAAVAGTRASGSIELEFDPVIASVPSVIESVLLVVAALCLPVVVLGMFLRRRRRLEDADDKRTWSRLVVGAALILGVIVLQGMFRDPDDDDAQGGDVPLETDAGAGVEIPGWSAWAAALALCLAAGAAAALWWRVRAASGDRVEPAATGPDDEAAAVAAARAALEDRSTDPRAAVVNCYAAMEHALASSGAARGHAESPEELLARAVAQGRLPAEPGRRLTDLFLVARYSSRPITDGDVAEGRAALRHIDARVRR